MKSSRGHYRPLFGVGVGRSPPFLVAALTIGLCILAVSYWRLALQYHDLEEQLKRLIQKRDSLEANQSFINKQLEIREENFSEAKVSLQKKEQEVEDLKKKQDQTGKELAEIKSSLDLIKQANDKLKSDTSERDKTIELLRSQNKALESDKTKLDAEIKELKQKLANATTLKQSVSQPQSQNANIPKPESAAKDPVYKLVNSAPNSAANNAAPVVKPEAKHTDSIPAPPPPVPKPSNSNSDQIAPPPDPKNSAPVVEDKLKVAESKQNVDIIDPEAADDVDMEKDDAGHGDQNQGSNQDLELPKNAKDNSMNYEVDNPKNGAPVGAGPIDKNQNDNQIDSVHQL